MSRQLRGPGERRGHQRGGITVAVALTNTEARQLYELAHRLDELAGFECRHSLSETLRIAADRLLARLSVPGEGGAA